MAKLGCSRSDRLTTTLCNLGISVDVLTWSRYLQPGEVLPPNPSEASDTPLPRVFRVGIEAAVSADMSRKIQLLAGRDEVVILKNAVNEQIFSHHCPSSALRESLGIGIDEVVLGFCGELREKKGQQFLLNALTTVRTQRPACLLIIGEVRASQESVLQLYATQHLEHAKRIIITGHLPNPATVAEHLRLCNVYLQPSLWDGMPNALLEALMFGAWEFS